MHVYSTVCITMSTVYVCVHTHIYIYIYLSLSGPSSPLHSASPLSSSIIFYACTYDVCMYACMYVCMYVCSFVAALSALRTSAEAAKSLPRTSEADFLNQMLVVTYGYGSCGGKYGQKHVKKCQKAFYVQPFMKVFVLLSDSTKVQ